MSKYEAQKFLDALGQKGSHDNLKCPYCGGTEFSTPEEYGSIIISQEMSGISLGPNVPVGMIFCTNCGHVDLFALGVLNLLEKKEDDKNAK